MVLDHITTYRMTWKLLSLMCFYYQPKKASEQPCSNGEPIRHTVLWEGIRTTHKTIPGPPWVTSPWARQTPSAVCK